MNESFALSVPMPFELRKSILEEIESLTGRPLIVFVNSHRPNASGQIAGDTPRLFIDQLFKLPEKITKLDLLIHSMGGDGLASWRIISAIREFLGPKGKLRALVPNNAFSAATLLALGCDEIFMHPIACLGPVDPQITVPKAGGPQRFAYEDLVAFGDFVDEELKIKNEDKRALMVEHLVKEIQPTALGFGKRSSSQSQTMSVGLLKMHTKDEAKIKKISAALNKSFHSHSHAVSRSQAKSIGLKIADRDPKLEKLIWSVYEDFEKEMEMRKPFDILQEVLRHVNSSTLLQAPPLVNLPGNAPPPVQHQIWQNVIQSIQIQPGLAIDLEVICASVESLRQRDRFVMKYKALATRKPDMEFMISAPLLESGWVSY